MCSIIILIFTTLCAVTFANPMQILSQTVLQKASNANELPPQVESLQQPKNIVSARNACPINVSECDRFCKSLGKNGGKCGGFLSMTCICY